MKNNAVQKLALFLMFIFASPAFGSSKHEAIPYLVNDREGETQLLSRKEQNRIKDALRFHGRQELRDFYVEVVEEASNENACAFDLLNQIEEKRARELPRIQALSTENLLKSFRYIKVIDDLVLEIFLKANEVNKHIDMDAADAPAVELPRGSEFAPFGQFAKRREGGECLDQNFKRLFSDYRRKDKNFSSKSLYYLTKKAYRENIISEKVYEEIKAAFKEDVNSWRTSLSDYQLKKKNLRLQRPLGNSVELSDFVAKTLASGESMRSRLYKSYDFIQIIYMAELVTKLKARLASPKMVLNVFDRNGNLYEAHELGPMDRFDYALSMVRLEMAELRASSLLFKNKKPAYIDLIAAAYETGVVGAEAMKELAGLEELWNPTTTFWEKAQIWIRLGGNAVAAVLPTPYRELTVMGLVLIEAYNEEERVDSEHRLFKD